MYYFMQIVNVLYGDELYHAQVKIKLVTSSLCYVFLINAKLCSYVKNVLHAIISCFHCVLPLIFNKKRNTVQVSISIPSWKSTNYIFK